ncbi:MAG: DUF1015 family protein [Gammaproteobacteria bacterium]
MSLIRPFRGLRPAPDHADDVVAPPYDVLSSAEARQRASGRPWSFLHISKAEIDLPEDTSPYDPAVYAKAAENLERLVTEGILQRDAEPCYYVYRIIMGGHVQTGLVAAASVAEYDVNRVRKHEFTRPDKEDDRVRQIEALGAQTGPVLLTYRADQEVDALLKTLSESEPEYNITADDGVEHAIWVIQDQTAIDAITRYFDAMTAVYIADGHHRSAAASRVAANLGGDSDSMNNYFLSVLFPHTQMKIFDYNRVVKDLNNLSVDDFIKKISVAFSIVRENSAVSPDNAGEFGMYLDGSWYRLTIKPERIPEDPVGRLDVSLLATNLFEPFLNINDPRRDPRIDFVGGIRGLSELERRVNNGEMAAAFSMYATSMEDLMAVADAQEVMPPKSTWFEPKLADGLLSHVLD